MSNVLPFQQRQGGQPEVRDPNSPKKVSEMSLAEYLQAIFEALPEGHPYKPKGNPQ